MLIRFVRRSLLSLGLKKIKVIPENLVKKCKFLRTREEVAECTDFLRKYGFYSHNLICKDWDLAHILPEIGDGNFLDMGSSDSYILKNVALKRIHGAIYGIDLREPDVPVKGVKYSIGDLTDTTYPNNFFRNITCLSVIEHGVDFELFAREASRLLEKGGRLFLTFDYWKPKISPPIKMYDLPWEPLDDVELKRLVAICETYGLKLLQDIDWTIDQAVICDGYYSPHPDVSYTFGLVAFEKTTG